MEIPVPALKLGRGATTRRQDPSVDLVGVAHVVMPERAEEAFPYRLGRLSEASKKVDQPGRVAMEARGIRGPWLDGLPLFQELRH